MLKEIFHTCYFWFSKAIDLEKQSTFLPEKFWGGARALFPNSGW